MAILGKPQGVFDLAHSDHCVGSYIQEQDAAEILGVTVDNLSNLEFASHDGVVVIDERKLQKAWYENRIPGAPPVDKSSLDELILATLIRRTYPDAQIETQVRVDRYLLDFKVTLGSDSLFIEFDGPYHFSQSRFGLPKDPRIKRDKVQTRTGTRLINWPYWIQRCESNVRALFDTGTWGFGVLWSTEIHFGMYIFEDSADLIEDFTSNFRAVDQDGYGYFYGPNTRERNNPAHPIVDKILKGKSPVGTLIPKGSQDSNYWLPSCLKK